MHSIQRVNELFLEIKQIIKGCIKQDRKAQKLLYETYKRPIFSVCLKYSSTVAEAEDLLHDGFIDILENLPKYRFEGSFEGWMKRIVIYKAIGRFKSKPKTLTLDTQFELRSQTEVSIDDSQITLDQILAAVQKLPTQYRLVFCLYELDEYSHKEIAGMLSIAESTSKSNLHRAKLQLKEMLSTKKNHKKVSNGA